MTRQRPLLVTARNPTRTVQSGKSDKSSVRFTPDQFHWQRCVSAESTTSARRLDESVVERACRHSPLIARVWVRADKCAYAGVGDGIY